jgi:hypothetical protein
LKIAFVNIFVVVSAKLLASLENDIFILLAASLAFVEVELGLVTTMVLFI